MKNSKIKFNMRNFPFFNIEVKEGGKKTFLIVILLILVLIPVFVYLGGIVVQFLWNQSIASIFDLKEITFTQAIALLFLCKILFGILQQKDPNDYDESSNSGVEPLEDLKPLPPLPLIKEIE